MEDLYAKLLEHGIRLRSHDAGERRSTCPKCSHQRAKKSDPCLAVLIDDEGGATWNCHHCAWSGNVPAPRHGEDGSRPQSRVRPHRQPAPVKPKVKIGEPDAELMAWFTARGIPEAIVRRNRIFATQAWMPGADAEVRCIAFPYLRGGDVVNVKYRAIGAKQFRQEKGAEKILYGLDDIADAAEIVIVEGECDKLACEAAGLLNVVSVPDGAPAKVTEAADSGGRKFSFVTNCADALDGKTIVIATDADAPGAALAEELARRLGKERCRRVHWPDSGDTPRKDANEVLLHDGPDVLRECIANAEHWPIEGLHGAHAFADAVLDLYRSGRSRGVSTGWAAVDKLMTIRPGELTVVTGTPGSGKSEFVDALCVNLTERHGWTVALCSFENPPDEHLAKLAEKRLGVPFFAGPTARMTEAELGTALDWIDQHFVFIRADHDDAPNIDFVLAAARGAVARHGVRALVIDPYNEIEAQRPERMSETEYVSAMLTKVKRFARNHGVHVFFVAHPAKMRPENGKLPVPTLYDIAGSAHWVNKADIGLVVHRDRSDGNDIVELHVRKVRFKAVGRIGMEPLRYDRSNGRYHDDLDRAGSRADVA